MLSLQNSEINHLFAEIHRDYNFMLCNTKWSVFPPLSSRSTSLCSFLLDWNSTQALIHSHVRINSKLYTDYCRIVRCNLFFSMPTTIKWSFSSNFHRGTSNENIFFLWLFFFYSTVVCFALTFFSLQSIQLSVFLIVVVVFHLLGLMYLSMEAELSHYNSSVHHSIRWLEPYLCHGIR